MPVPGAANGFNFFAKTFFHGINYFITGFFFFLELAILIIIKIKVLKTKWIQYRLSTLVIQAGAVVSRPPESFIQLKMILSVYFY